MAVYAIICEYNPFHNGHKFQIDSLKPNTVVCLMSSNFVQRGSIAVCDKYERAEAAVKCGADLVLELPFPYSMMSAEYFAGAGISILERLGIADYLSFGCENEDYDSLRAIAEYLLSENYNAEIKSILEKKPYLPYASAREAAVRTALGGDLADILTAPNNILAVEYIKAIIKSGSKIVPKPLKRHFADHNGAVTDESFANAGALRDMLERGESIKSYVPLAACEVYERLLQNGRMPAEIGVLETAILAFLRMTPTEELKKYYDCRAVAEIIKNAASKAVNLEELYEQCATKSFTRARIRRCITAAYFGVTSSAQNALPNYTSVLALNSKGAALLSQIRKNTEIALITKPAHIKKYAETEIYRDYMNELRADDVYALCFSSPGRAGESMKRTPYVVK